MAFWHNKAFQELQSKWYRRLAKAGFKDIEESPTHQHTETARFKDRELVEVYFTNARAYLHIGKFHSRVEKKIWALHSEGASLREIGAELELSKDSIARIVNNHKLRMQVIKWAELDE